MKFNLLTIVALTIASTTVLAKAKPVTEDISLKNAEFSEAIYEALEGQIKPKKETMMAGSNMYAIRVQDGFTCLKSVSKSGTRFSCVIMADTGWNSMGMESYGAGDNEELSDALYEALDLPVTDEGAILIKTLELNVKDANGGTERNGITCMKPTKEGIEMGFRTTCQIMNAL